MASDSQHFGLYTLDASNEPIPCDDVLEWSRWMQAHGRIVACTEINGLRVSTVFLGVDHNFGCAPVLFETMIFAKGTFCVDDYQERYCTQAEAIAGHTRAVDAVLAKRVRFVGEESPK